MLLRLLESDSRNQTRKVCVIILGVCQLQSIPGIKNSRVNNSSLPVLLYQDYTDIECSSDVI